MMDETSTLLLENEAAPEANPEAELAEPENEPETETAAPAPAPAHAEATILAFTEYYAVDGQRWSVTVRQGVTRHDIDQMMAAIRYTTVAAQDAGMFTTRPGSNDVATVPPKAEPKPASAAAEGGAKASVASRSNGSAARSSARTSGTPGKLAWGHSDDHNEADREGRFVYRLRRIKIITNDDDKAVLEMYSANEKWKYACGKAPAWKMLQVIEDCYPGIDKDDYAWLDDAGKSYEVNWLIVLEPSQKNPKYKDLMQVVIPELEEGGDKASSGGARDDEPPADGAGLPGVTNSASFWKWLRDELCPANGLNFDDVKAPATEYLKKVGNDYAKAAAAIAKKYNRDDVPPF